MNKNVLKNFSVDDIYLYENDNDADFAIMRLYFLASGNNSHNSPISDEVLRRDADTALGKFIVARYDPYKRDVMSHETDEVIIGYIPQDSEITFEEKDNKLFAVATAVISKLYASNVYELFKKNNYRSVSAEFTCVEGDELPDGGIPIESFVIRGITILGQDVRPAVEGAEAEIVRFSAEGAEKYYHDHSVNTFDKLKDFSERRKKSMAEKTYKVDKSKDAMSDSAWGSVDKTSLRNKIMEASNRASLVKDVYMLVEDGWEDSPSEHLKYPVMEFKGDTLVYNRGGLSSALGYAKAENEQAVASKVEAIYKKLGLDKEKQMAEQKFEIEGREAWGDVIKAVQDHEGEGAYVDSVEKDHIIFTKDDVRYHVDADVTASADDKKVSAKIDWSTKKKDAGQKEFADDEKEVDKADKSDEPNDDKDAKDGEGDDSKAEDFAQEKCECADDSVEEMCGQKMGEDGDITMSEEKKFSYDANIDMAAYNAMLANETEDFKQIVQEAYDSKDMNIIMSKYLEMAKECDALNKYKCEREAQDVKCAVDSCLAEAKADLTAEQYADLQKRGAECKMSDLSAFSNTVKSFAYDNAKSKNSNKDTENHINMRTFGAYENYVNKTENVEDVFKKYL